MNNCIICNKKLNNENVGLDLDICIDCTEEMQLDDIFGFN